MGKVANIGLTVFWGVVGFTGGIHVSQQWDLPDVMRTLSKMQRWIGTGDSVVKKKKRKDEEEEEDQ